jgi:hypothetical protein
MWWHDMLYSFNLKLRHMKPRHLVCIALGAAAFGAILEYSLSNPTL